MRIVVSSSGLESRVKNLCKVINSKPVLPILGDIMVEVNEVKKIAVLTASDSEIWLSYTIWLTEAEGNGRFCVSATTLQAMLSGIVEQPVTIDIDPTFTKMTLTHQKGSSFCPIGLADEFPERKVLDNGETLGTLDGKTLKNGIKRSLFATVNDTLRPILNGIYFKFDAHRLDIVASNGHQLMMTAAVLDHVNEAGSFVIPKKAAQILQDLMDNDDDINLTFDENSCSIEGFDMIFSFRFIEGTFPNYKSVIPEEFKHSVLCNRVNLIMALQAVSPFTPDSSNMAALTFHTDGTLEVKGDDYDFSVGATQRIDTDYEGEEISIGIKAGSMITMLQKMQTLEVTLRFNDPSRAITITPFVDNYENLNEVVTGLTMPMMMNDTNNDNNGQATEG